MCNYPLLNLTYSTSWSTFHPNNQVTKNLLLPKSLTNLDWESLPLVSSMSIVLDVLQRLSAFVDHEADAVGDVVRWRVGVPRLVDDVNLCYHLLKIWWKKRPLKLKVTLQPCKSKQTLISSNHYQFWCLICMVKNYCLSIWLAWIQTRFWKK